jgi:redox-sensitive bicupin YhaK (pirin superfamily)
MAAKAVLEVRGNVAPHWVGDGFPVRSLFSYQGDAAAMSPFLLLDYAGPTEFPPDAERRGVGEHPHRGFATVTLVYQGELEHRDSTGNHGRIGPGDVQWMTAASGVVHEEFHSAEFSRRGGSLEMVQLWVNLPAAFKMSAPRYQAILDAEIPAVALDDGAGLVRVIAGEFRGTPGPARSVTPVHLWDIRLRAGGVVELPLPEGYTTAMVVQRGTIAVNGSTSASATALVRFDRRGTGIALACQEEATALLLCGEPIDEPVVGHGPFVMNSAQEIAQAIADYRAGTMGHLG